MEKMILWGTARKKLSEFQEGNSWLREVVVDVARSRWT